MAGADALRSGKGHRDENFPVASHLIRPKHRAVILAFYDFVRTADDIADHARLHPEEKLANLDRLEASLLGQGGDEPAGVKLGATLEARQLSPVHAQELLAAFRLDVTKLRYRDWDDLIAYCRLSAMPVGRFVLDVHGESRATWPASDAVCAALQINNHLQDCGKDYRELDRVYLPVDALEAAGARVEDLGAQRASPALRECLRALAVRTGLLLREGEPLPGQINDLRLSLEVSIIHALAVRINAMLAVRDPLAKRVHLRKGGFLAAGLLGVARGLVRRVGGPAPAPAAAQDV